MYFWGEFKNVFVCFGDLLVRVGFLFYFMEVIVFFVDIFIWEEMGRGIKFI